MTVASFPNAGIAAKVDSAGNIFVAGVQVTTGTLDSYDAFVAKVSPDGSKIFYSTKFAGSKYDSAVALDIDASGAAYILGQTSSPDFPVTPGALQTTAPGSGHGFVVKVDGQGKVVYGTLIGEIIPNPGGPLVTPPRRPSFRDGASSS